MLTDIGQYQVEIQNVVNCAGDSADNLVDYENIYFSALEFVLPTKIGIRIYENKNLIASAIIGSIGGGTGIHDKSQIIEIDRLVMCCSDSIFCLSIPDLSLIWKTQADQATCFEIFKHQDSYVVHGELEISRLGLDGKILWQQRGADIFTTEKVIDDFEITETYIRATDWENRTYKFNFEGILIE